VITKTEIEGLFADFLPRITDEGLRQQVVDCWFEGCKEGNWTTVDQLESMPFTLLTDTRGFNFIQHCRAVTAGAEGLARALNTYMGGVLNIESDVLIAGGLLHDLGKLMEIEADGEGGYRKSHAGRCARHPISGAILAGKLGVAPEVVNVIACHASEGNNRPQRIETVLVHQADFATFNPLVMLKKGDLIV
jgi:putative nucleotidyltransferase with HDIG domain